MTDTAPQTDAPTDGQPADGDEPQSFDADYVKKLRAESAKWRTEARANAEAATKLQQLEEAKKTTEQKLAEAAEAARKEAEQARNDALRYRIATKFQINDEDADLFLRGGDEESITKAAERLVALRKPGTPAPDPSQGASNTPPTGGDMNAIIRRGLGRSGSA